MSIPRLTRAVAGALVVSALAAPAATARPAFDPPPQPRAAEPTTAAPQAISTGAGVEWGSIALGAGGATVVFVLAGAGALPVSRRHRARVTAGS